MLILHWDVGEKKKIKKLKVGKRILKWQKLLCEIHKILNEDINNDNYGAKRILLALLKRFNCDERRAQMMITHTDNDRIGFNRYFFDIGWRDPVNYDFIINTQRLNATQTANIIKNILPQLIDQKQEAQCKEAICNLITSQKILTKVLYEEKLPIYFLEALYDGNSVTLNGVTNAPSCIEKVSAIAKKITGCNDVHSNIYIASDIPLTHEV